MKIITDTRNPMLRAKCEELKEFNLNTVSFMNQLAITMKKNSGFGLAAPQVGMPIRAFSMTTLSGEIIKVVNPIILEKGKLINSKREGCLSLPNKRYNVKRHKRVKVKFQNEIGEFIKREFKNFDAFVFQHEFDHLNGILISD
ncbi:MAG: peptide deformylase [Actinomycetia bacterium]|nr:peptide deformylase [Actinomycetes bacterium]